MESRQSAESSAVSLDGVRYAEFSRDGRGWRLGSADPLWDQHLPGQSLPDAETLAGLAGRGTFLEPVADTEPTLAVLCCGQGSVWPGMGRELYDSFPEARAAMDRLAACTDWDVLALMDEPDVESIGLTRWQQPYLFLLEYAQWTLFRARGLRPAFLCGHSLGELIALCLAGVYSPEVCWYVLETRSRHVADLEARSRSDTGMLAVYAGWDVVSEVLGAWPDVHVSNINTPGQSILSGPRDTLSQVRRALRKRRLPAVLLNVTMAFHHPAMRVLRDLGYRGLMAQEMHAPALPMLSCVTASPYPAGQPAVCRWIMDLDESTVRWTDCVSRLRQREGVRDFLELGPMDTLGTLVTACDPAARCFSSSARGREREAVRRALAALHAAGHLDIGRIRQVAADIRGSGEEPAPEAPETPHVSQEARARAAKEQAAGIPELRALLARACHRPPESIRGSQDLRFDLALRSSAFPALIEEAREILGVDAPFEALLNVATVADLERIFRGGGEEREEIQAGPPLGALVRRPFLARCRPKGEGEADYAEIPDNPCAASGRPGPETRFLVRGTDDDLTAALCQGLAPLGCAFLLPEDLPRTRALAVRMGGRLLPGTDGEADILLCQDDGPLAGILPALRRALEEGACRRAILLRRGDPEPVGPEFLDGGRLLVVFLDPAWVPPGTGPGSPPPVLPGDLLRREIMAGTTGLLCWRRQDEVRCLPQPLQDDARRSPLVFPERVPAQPRDAACSLWSAQFSPELFPGLEALPAREGGWRTLPLALLLEAQCQAAELASGGLRPAGIVDLRLTELPGLRRGLVREARLGVGIRPWLRYRGVMSRMAHVQTETLRMSPEGRRSPLADRASECSVILTGGGPADLFLPLRPDPAAKPFDSGAWYDRAGIAPGMRLLEKVTTLPFHGLRAELLESSFLALSGVWPYTEPSPSESTARLALRGACRRSLWALEAVLQAAAMAAWADPPSEACAPLPRFLGFVLFGRAGEGPLTLSLERVWDGGGLVRCEARVTDPSGHCLVSVSHLEYNAPASS